MTTILLYRDDDDDGIKGTGVVDHIGLGGEGHDDNGGPRGGTMMPPLAGGLASVLRLTDVG